LFPRGLCASAARQDRRPLLWCQCARGDVVHGSMHGLADCTARPCAAVGAAAHHISVTVEAPFLQVSQLRLARRTLSYSCSKQVKAPTRMSHRARHACRARLSCRANVGTCITTFYHAAALAHAARGACAAARSGVPLVARLVHLRQRLRHFVVDVPPLVRRQLRSAAPSARCSAGGEQTSAGHRSP